MGWSVFKDRDRWTKEIMDSMVLEDFIDTIDGMDDVKRETDFQKRTEKVQRCILNEMGLLMWLNALSMQHANRNLKWGIGVLAISLTWDVALTLHIFGVI